MTTRRDLVEAQAFQRRRLVAALVGGVPDALDSGPPRPGRVLLGSVALAVLLLAGGAVAGMVLDRPDAGWLDDGSFVVSRATGQQYVVVHGGSAEEAVLQRVPNHVSAQLVLGEPDPEAHAVAEGDLAGVSLGPDLGIAGAPSVLPRPEDLVGSGWTACTGDGLGTRVTVGAGGSGAPGRPHVAFLVRAGRRGPAWLVASAPGGERGGGPEGGGARRFQLPDDPEAVGTLLDRLGVGAADRIPVVDEEWLELFPVGPALRLEAFGVSGAGPARYDHVSPDLSRFDVGDLVHTPDDRTYLLADDAPQRLDPFPALLHAAVGTLPHELDSGISAAFGRPDHPEEWPRVVPDVVVEGDLCGVLVTDDEGGPRVVLATDVARGAAADDVPRGGHRVHVDPAAGAYARADADRGADETPYVVAATGTRHALVGPGVADHLGYADVVATRVPSAWLELFDTGPPLSVEVARRGPR